MANPFPFTHNPMRFCKRNDSLIMVTTTWETD